MAAPIIAPWLQTRPADFVDAARAGAAVGVQARGQDLEHAAAMARIAQASQEAQMAAQEASEKLAVQREIEKSRRSLQISRAANLFQQQQQRQRAIDSGMSPAQAWLEFPGNNSDRSSAEFAKVIQSENRASTPLQIVKNPNDQTETIGVIDGTGQFHPTPRRAISAPKLDPRDAAAIKHLTETMKAADAGLSGVRPGEFGADQKRNLLKQKLQAQQALQALGVPINGVRQPVAAPSGALPSVAPGGPPPPPQQGQIVNGHKFLGGDPADENSWQEVGTGGSSFIGTPGYQNQAEVPGDYQDEGDSDQD